MTFLFYSVPSTNHKLTSAQGCVISIYNTGDQSVYLKKSASLLLK